MPSPADSETQSLSGNLSARPSLAVGAHLSPGEISSQSMCFQQKAESIVYFRMTAVVFTVQGSFTFPDKNRTAFFLEGAPHLTAHFDWLPPVTVHLSLTALISGNLNSLSLGWRPFSFSAYPGHISITTHSTM